MSGRPSPTDDAPTLPEQTSDDVDANDPELTEAEDIERLLREVPPHHVD